MRDFRLTSLNVYYYRHLESERDRALGKQTKCSSMPGNNATRNVPKFLQSCRYTGLNVLEVIRIEGLGRWLLVLRFWNHIGKTQVRAVDIPALESPWPGQCSASGLWAVCKQYVHGGQRLGGSGPSSLWSFPKENLCWQRKKTWK
jgi:hypothetical protein